MRSQRPLIGTTLGVLICIGGAGCAVNSSITSRNPGRRTESAAPQRLLAIAKVFEQQGHLDRAASMYERVLDQDPSSIQARTAIAHIASMNQPRDFRGAQPSLAEVRGETRLATSSYSHTPMISPVADSLQLSEPEAITRSLTPVEMPGLLELPQVPPESESELAAATMAVTKAVEISTQAVSSVGLVSDVSAATNRLVSLEEVKHQTVSAAKVMAGLGQVADSNVNVLLKVLNESEDPERRAVAASLLADAPENDTRVDDALARHCANDIALVSSAACESLLTRGLVSDQMIRTLLSHSEHPDASIRSQVSVSLRRLAETPWEDDAVQASLIRLDDTSPTVRGLAALTLSEFPGRSALILERLVERYELEMDEGARGSLELAAERIASVAIDEGVPLPFAE